ncbi:L,D-transpeptidase|uniref:L,D-transpeptidase catalytic domain n=1 Tax=Dendrosporobacter quercicolus TaxID=146817 RepID=A0A1G9XSN0_9FIRM|nr:L,D-transpeptidase [Dendrosporobacter quercicolus]NSL49105.1 L,D-transpeptidase [Dendrosporobacter quercicolus DSM 1736]SDM99416.1 L,D-transpeptidase catalytic domain [Dendrosporobacter quercicolus]
MAYYIVIALSQRRLTLFNNGKPVRAYPVGVGKQLSPTPTGRYQIVNKRPHPGGAFGAMWLGLNLPHYGIHGTNNPSSIGGFVSKGCIRMYNHDVTQLAGLVSIGTMVYITA